MTENRIKEHRLRRDLSQAQLAALCGTTTQTICKLELGQRAISGRWLGLLSQALGVPKGALLRHDARDGTEPVDCDVVQDGLERTILRFWRSLPDEGKDAVLRAVTSWASDTTRRGSVRSA